MIKEVASIELPVHESMVVRKNRLMPKNYKDGDNLMDNTYVMRL